MEFLKLLLSIDIIIAAMAISHKNLPPKTQTAVDHDLSNNVKPIHYNIKLILPIKEDIFRGESNTSIEIYEKTQHIKLHSVNLIIIKPTLIKNIQKSENNIEKLVYKPIRYSYVHKTDTYIMHFSDIILPGNYSLNMNFLGKVSNDTKGIFRTSYKNEQGNTIWLFATYLRTTGARYLFPCWDEPKLKAEFTISVKHPQKYSALSNMPIREKHNAENNMIWTHFITTPPMPSHFIAIAIIGYNNDYIFSYEIDKNIIFDKFNVTVWFRKEMQYKIFVYQLLQRFIEYLEHDWNMLSLKIIPKVDYVAIPDFPEQAIATWGLVIYREADIFYEPCEEKSQINVESLITYNILDESLSDVPSWLKEGLASFIIADIIDKTMGNVRRMEWFIVQNQHESLRLNFYFNRNLNNNLLQTSRSLDINSLPSFLRYNKAFSVLRMLQHLITDEAFLLGTTKYLQNRNLSISSEIFWTSMQSALKMNENKTNLIEKMNGWTKDNSYPILKAICNFADYVEITLENFDSIDVSTNDLWIPITHTIQTNPDFDKTSLDDVQWVTFSKDLKISFRVSGNFSENDWFIINLQQVGYYRVNYDTKNWKKIAKYLNSMEYTKIHVLNRAQIIDDAYHFLITRKINSSVFWEITNYLSQETNFIAWYPMIKALEHMSSVLPLSDKRVYDIKEKMQITLNGLLQNIKYIAEFETYLNLTYINCLRQEATKWACIFDESNCKIVAGSKLQQHLTNRITNKLLPGWKEWTYCNGLAMSGINIWNNVFDIYINETDNRYLRFLACSENIAIIQKYTTLITLEDCNGIMKNKNCLNSFHFIIAKHAKNSLMLDYILAYFERIVPRQATVAILIDIINHVYSTEHLNKISGTKIGMALLKLLLSLSIIIVVIAAPTSKNKNKNLSTAINYILSNNVKPIHYNIELILNIEEGIYRGKSNINIVINKEIQYIELHASNLAITESTLINEDVRESKNEKFVYKPTKYSYIQEINLLLIHFNKKLLPGNYTLNIEFFAETIDNVEGVFRTSYINKNGDKMWLIATHMEATGARQLFPCWDEPELKARFTISVKHSLKYKVLSNMPVQEKQIVESNMVWTHFNTTPLMSPNLVAIVAIDFTSTSDDGKVKIWHREKASRALYTYIFTDLITTILENEWCTITLKTIPKVDYVAIPDFPEEAVVTWGLVLYRETNINDKLSLLDMTHEKMEASRLIAYNVAQESLKNISPWLNEGLARFLEIYAIHKNFQFNQMMDMLVVQLQHESFRLNSYFNDSTEQITNSKINSLSFSLQYKAFSILRMLQYLLTDKVFQDGIKKYLHTNACIRQTTLNDFWIAMQDALDKSYYDLKDNLMKRMNGWIKHESYPIITIMRYYSHTNIQLENIAIDNDLWVPMTYTTQNKLNFNNTSLYNVEWLQFTPQKSYVEIFENVRETGWIILNLQQAGYYRVNYDIHNWKTIITYLNSMEYTKIHVLNRAQIIDDAYYFLTIKRFDSSLFWQLTKYLSRETDYVAWYPMIKALEHMSKVFPISDGRVYNIKINIKEILNNLLRNIGYEESNKNYLTNCLKQEATKWACVLDEPECKTIAGSKLQQHLANRTTNKLLPWWKEWTYCNGLMTDNSIWNDVFDIYIKESDSKYLKFLACSGNIAIIQNYTLLMAMKDDNITAKSRDHINSFHFIIAKHAKNEIMLDYILANFEKIRPRQSTTNAILVDLINNVYTEKQLDKIRQFAESHEKNSFLTFCVEEKIKKRLNEIENQTKYLVNLSDLKVSRSY